MPLEWTMVKNNQMKNDIKLLCLILGGLAVNLGGAWLAKAFSLPIYLDCIGTIAVAIMGGYFPAIIVGFLSNFISGFSEYSNAYYSVINVLIATFASAFASKKYFKISWKVIIPIAVLTLCGGGIGSFITYGIYGSSIGEEISSSLAYKIYDGFIHNEYLAELLASLIIDLPDKIISVVAAMGLAKIIPDKLLPPRTILSFKQAKITGLSLSGKVAIVLSTAIVAVAAVVSYVSFKQFEDSNLEQESRYARDIAEFAAQYINPDMVDTYIKYGDDKAAYRMTEKKLELVWGSSPRIEYLYVYQIQEDGCHVVFDIDTPDMEGSDPGDLVAFDESFSEYIPALLAGEEIEPLVTNDTYGWLLTAYVPVYDSEGNCKCYVATDIAMPDLVANVKIFAFKMVSLLLGFFGAILATGIYLANRVVVDPIKSMSGVTREVDYSTPDARIRTIEKVKSLGIDTGDEIEDLYRAFYRSAKNTNNYISDAERKADTIEKLQTGMINIMADLVESRDQSTGNHIKNTAAYVEIIVNKMMEEGIYKEQLSEGFKRDVIASAPLHDIGKIVISDVILNKPGKLDDDEFEKMKTHTTAGDQIIDSVIHSVDEADSGYLMEAEEMAHYHHEKWNGTGYPVGLKGEEIPLSARIMAVADVFDALVSKRSYKDGMPFEKAMGIIKEGSGSHFDPNIVKAFVDSEEEVRKIAEDRNNR